MTRSKTTTQEVFLPPNLLISHEEATDKIRNQINKGLELAGINILSVDDFDFVYRDAEKWIEYNIELLTRIFDNKSEAEKYKNSGGMSFALIDTSEYIHIRAKALAEYIDCAISPLENLLERIELIPVSVSINSHTSASDLPCNTHGNDVFIVHGHDSEAKTTVARFLEKLKLHPVILHEQANKGRTVIEKFEACSDVSYAIVLLTPDDIGGLKDESDHLYPRARQNVIFELGFFLGRLGRTHLCALYKEGVEIPTDIQGVIYIPMDTHGGWRISVAMELQQAGFVVDLNNLTS